MANGCKVAVAIILVAFTMLPLSFAVTGSTAKGYSIHPICMAVTDKDAYLSLPLISSFPSIDPDDGKFLTMTGSDLSTLAGTKIIVYIAVEKSATNFTLGVFDGDQSGLWDYTMGTPDEMLFSIYADPLKNGTYTIPVDTLSSTVMYDDAWFLTTYGVSAAAKAPSGNYFYRMEIQWATPSISNDINSFKLCSSGQVSIAMDAFGFIGAPVSKGDPGVGADDPNPGEINDPYANSYNGTWNFYFYFNESATSIKIVEGDADHGLDSDSVETPNLDPDGPGPAKAEGENPGKPADDGGAASNCSIPGYVQYDVITPDGVHFLNENPSGDCEWENWTIHSSAGMLFRPGIYTLTWKFVDAHNAVYINPVREIYAQPFVPLPVYNSPPVAIAGDDAYGEIGAEIVFDGSLSYDPDGTITAYEWDFGDGTRSTCPIINHSYSSKGTFTATLYVVDDSGSLSTDSRNIHILNVPPVAVSCPDAIVYRGDKIVFDGGKSYDPDGFIVSYTWEFSDGVKFYGRVTSRIFYILGTYSVTLTVTDSDGASSSMVSFITVLNNPPVANAGPDLAGKTSTKFTFDGSKSFDKDGTIVSYVWKFSDGLMIAGRVTSRMFSLEGTYTVELTVTDNDGALSKDYAHIQVSDTLSDDNIIDGAYGDEPKDAAMIGGGEGKDDATPPTPAELDIPSAGVTVEKTNPARISSETSLPKVGENNEGGEDISSSDPVIEPNNSPDKAGASNEPIYIAGTIYVSSTALMIIVVMILVHFISSIKTGVKKKK